MKIEKITAKALKESLDNSDYETFLSIKENLKDDTRKSIHNLINQAHRKFENKAKKLAEYNNRKTFETKLLKENYKFIAGIDEVGRGPLAGPVYAAAVILDPTIDIIDIKDSKKLSEKQRELLSIEIKDKALAYSIGIATEEEIDSLNILNATKLAMTRAIEGLNIRPDHLLIDAVNLKEISIAQTSIIKGDDLSISIGAASIIAKVERDNFMKDISQRHPNYYFDQNKGYGTKEHIEAIQKYGPCKVHRKTFIQNFI